MSESPESKDELMPLRRSTRKSVVAKVEEQVLTPKKRKSTSTPLKNVLEKASDNGGTPRKTRGAATPRKSVADQISLTPRKSVSNARSDESPKKKDIITPRKTLATYTSPTNASKETNKRTPRKSTAAEISPVNTQRETNRRTPRKSLRSTKEIKKPDVLNEDEQKSVSEEVTASSRGKRKSVAASLSKRSSPSHSIKDSDSGIVSFDEDSQSTLEEQKLTPKKKSRKSVHFKKEVDEHHLQVESEKSNSPSPTKTVCSSLVYGEILKSSLALVPKVMLSDIKSIVREAESAESAIIEASYRVKENSSNSETKIPTENTLDKVLLSPAKFLTSDEDGADKEIDENLKIKVSNEKFSHASSQRVEFPESNIDKHKSPRRRLAYESRNVNETMVALKLDKKPNDSGTEAEFQNDSEVKETKSDQIVNEFAQGNSPQKTESSTFKETENAISIEQNEVKIDVEFHISGENNLLAKKNSLSPDFISSPEQNEHDIPVSNRSQYKMVKPSELCIVTTSENDLNINRATDSSEVMNSQLAVSRHLVSDSPVSSSDISKLSEKIEINKTLSEGEYQANDSYSVSSTGEIYEAELSLNEKGGICIDGNSELNASDASEINMTEKMPELVSYPKTPEKASNLEKIRVSLDVSTALIKEVNDAPELDNGLAVPEGNLNEINPDNHRDLVDQFGTVYKNATSSMPEEEVNPCDKQSENFALVTCVSDGTKPHDEVSQRNFEAMTDSLHSTSIELENTISPILSATQINLELSINRKDSDRSNAGVFNNSLIQTESLPELEEGTSEAQEGCFLKSDSLRVPVFEDLEVSEGSKVNERPEETNISNDSSSLMGDLNSSKSDNIVKSNVVSSEIRDGIHNENICSEEEACFRSSKSEIHETLSKSETLQSYKEGSFTSISETENVMEESEALSACKIEGNLDSSKFIEKDNGNKSLKSAPPELDTADSVVKSNTIIQGGHEEIEIEDVQNVSETSELNKSIEFDKIEKDFIRSSTLLNEDSPVIKSGSLTIENNLSDQSECFKLDLSNSADSDIQLSSENIDNDEEIKESASSSILSLEQDSSKLDSPKDIKSRSRTIDLDSALAGENNSNYGKVGETCPKSLLPHDEEHNSSSIQSPKYMSCMEDANDIESCSGTVDLNSTCTEEKNSNDKKSKIDETSPKPLCSHGVKHSSLDYLKSSNSIEDAIHASDSECIYLKTSHADEKNSNHVLLKDDESSPKSSEIPNYDDEHNSSSVKSPKNMSSIEDVTNESRSGTVLNSTNADEKISYDGKLKVDETSPKPLPSHYDDHNSSFIKSLKHTNGIEDVINESSSGNVDLNSTLAEEKISNYGKLKVDETPPKLLPPHHDDDDDDDDHNSSSIHSHEKLSNIDDIVNRGGPSFIREQLNANDNLAQKLIDSGENGDVLTGTLFEREEIISQSLLSGKRSKKQQHSFVKKSTLERNSASTLNEVLTDKNLSSRGEKNKSCSPLGKRSQTDTKVIIKKSKVNPENQKRSKLSKKKELECTENDIFVSDFIDLEAEEGEESEISNAGSSVEEAEESSNASSTAISGLDFLDKEAKECKKTCHVGTVDTLFNKTLSEDEEDTDWLPPKHVADNLASITLSQKLKTNLNRKLKFVKKTRPLKKSSVILMTKAGIFSNSTETLASSMKITHAPKGFKVSAAKEPLLAENYTPKGFIITESEKTSRKSNECSSSMLPVSTKSLKHHNSGNNEIGTSNTDSNIQKATNEKEIGKFSGMAVLPFRLKKSELKKAFGDVGINDIVSIEYRTTTTALLEFGNRKSLKKAIKLYGQIMHSGKPIYVLETNANLS